VSRPRIAIAGAGGGVGASVAFNLLLGGLDAELLLLDSRREMLLSHLWDLEQVIEQGSTGAVREGTEDDIADSDVLVVTAAAPLTVNESRMVYLEANATILAPLLEALPPDWGGVLIVVTNPVDPLCTWARQRTGLPRDRVLGYTLNDTLRLRTGIAKALAVPIGSVTAWTIGEHGDLNVPLLDRIEVGGAPARLTDAQRAEVHEFTSGWYVRHVALDTGRSSTWTSGLGVARMAAAVSPAPTRANGDDLWPASVVLRGEYGIEDVSLSVPVRLGAGGVAAIEQWSLGELDRERLAAAAEYVREAAAGLLSSAPGSARASAERRSR
jgi:malate dehydrogenase